MVYLYFAFAVILSRSESTFGKFNGAKRGNPISFNLFKTLAAFLASALMIAFTGMQFHGETFVYAAIYGVSLAVSMYAGLNALACGSMAIAGMLASFSLVIPCAFGLIFLNERLSVFGAVGLVLLLCSIALLNVKKGGGRISAKCWFFSILTMLANGVSSVIQKLHQTAFPGGFQTEFMIASMLCAFLLFFAYRLLTACKKGRTAEQESVEKPRGMEMKLGCASGVCNCISNYLILLLAAAENASVLFPALSAFNSVVSCLIGRFLFHEKLTKLQIVSIVLGIASVVLLKF